MHECPDNIIMHECPDNIIMHECSDNIIMHECSNNIIMHECSDIMHKFLFVYSSEFHLSDMAPHRVLVPDVGYIIDFSNPPLWNKKLGTGLWSLSLRYPYFEFIMAVSVLLVACGR